MARCTLRMALLAAGALGWLQLGIPSALAQERSDEAREKHAFIQQAMERVRAQDKKARKDSPMSSFAPPPAIVPFGDWDYYYVKDSPLQWKPNPGQPHKDVIVPIGFVTDLASIPRFLWTTVRPEGRYAYAAMVHDYLYWTQDRSREEADEIFRIAMGDSKVDGWKITAIYQLVRMAGQSAWDNNRKLKEQGEKRILKKFPTDFTESWSSWKKKPDVFAD